MRSRNPKFGTLLCLAFLFFLSSCVKAGTTPATTPHQAAAAQPPTVRTLQLPEIHERTTRNGIKIYVLEDHRAPIYMQQFWFKVGSANESESQGTTGLSHFFEHLMFRGTERHPDYFDEIARMGGQLNAFTWLDETTYWEKLPSKFLDTAIEMEADRIKNLKMDFLNFEPEREVVKSERLMRTDNDPAGKLDEALHAAAFRRSPYKWPTVGWMKDLISIPIHKAESYYQKHYVPENLYAVFVGDVNPDDVLKRMEIHFSGLRGSSPPPEPDLGEPPQHKERRVAVLMGVKTPIVQILFPTPEADSAEMVRLEVIDALLTEGRSSLLQRALVYGDDPLASSLSSFLFPMRGRVPYSISIRGLPGKSSIDILQRVQSVLDSLGTSPVPDTLLVRATRALQGRVVRYMKTLSGRAHVVGFALRATGDPLLPFRKLDAYGKVTPSEIQKDSTLRLAKSQRTSGFVINPDWLLDPIDAWTPKSETAHPLKTIIETIRSLHEVLLVESEVELEKQAIELLSNRAAEAKSAYIRDKKTAQALAVDAYLKDNEKGTRKRLEILGKNRKRLSEIKKTRAATLKSLRTRIKKFRQTPEQKKQRDILNWIADASRKPAERPPPNFEGLKEKNLHLAYCLAVALIYKVHNDTLSLNEWIARVTSNQPETPEEIQTHKLLEPLITLKETPPADPPRREAQGRKP